MWSLMLASDCMNGTSPAARPSSALASVSASNWLSRAPRRRFTSAT